MTHTSLTRRGTRIRRYAPALALVVTAAGTATVAAGSTTASMRPHGHTDTYRRLHFDVEFSPHSVMDLPPLGEIQPGDYAVFSDRLLNRAGQLVGAQGGSGLITKVRATGAQVYFSLAIRLRHGQIAAEGLSTTAPTKHLAVVGGTGRYAGADGHVVLVEDGDGTGTLTVTLRGSAD
jgi:hypothetical protein